jgi:glycosyltransferase involved in cell wall biosynthesis
MDAVRVDFVKYNRERLPQYRTETVILSTGTDRWVVKRALTPEAAPHVLNMIRGADLLRHRLSNANVPITVTEGNGVRMDFVRGTSVEHELLLMAMRGDRDSFIESIRSFRTYLETLGTSSSEMNGAVLDLLAEAPIEYLGDMMPAANLDLTFENVVVDHEGRRWITDQEWVFDSPVPISFIMYRSLYVLYLKNERRLGVMTFPEALMEAGVPEALWEPYRDACERFIDLVFGKERPHLIPSKYRKAERRLADRDLLESREQQLYATKLELDATKGALTEMMVHAKAREDRLQVQEMHLGQLCDAIEKMKSTLAEKDGLLESRRIEIESERLRLSAEHAQLEIERNHTFRLINDLEAERSLRIQIESDFLNERARKESILHELEGEQLLSMQLRQEMDLVRADLRIATEAMAKKELELAEITGQRDENFVHLQEMTERFMSKQAELMTMSDWARSMQLRLQFLESIPTIKLAERVAKVQKLGVEKLRSEGFISTMKDLAFKYSPQQVQQMFYHQEASNIKELQEDAVGKNVLVVFPVIPWEFRWQRPQQLVSRFAEHGYTVIFVNMTLTPKGSRYLNNAEALKDVKLGKLREHVFEVHLSTLDKINVYQDRIRGGDLNNLAQGLLSVLRELEPSSVTYLVQFPGWGQLANVARSRLGGTLVFDCMDDHAGFSNNATEVIKRETKLMESADLVVTSSAKLHEKALAFNDNSILVRNGTDFEMFHTLTPNGKLDQMKHPIIGYHGAISEWFDPGVVQRCAEKHPEWNFVLIGSTLGCEVNGLKKLTNVHLLGEMPYKDLPGYLHYFDACIIPFKVCELTLATNPVKFYEYISSGKPVVSVKLPEMVQYADICYLYEGDEEFEKGILAALAERDERLKAERIDVARKSSWDQRFQDIHEHLLKMEEGEGKRRKVL